MDVFKPAVITVEVQINPATTLMVIASMGVSVAFKVTCVIKVGSQLLAAIFSFSSKVAYIIYIYMYNIYIIYFDRDKDTERKGERESERETERKEE